MHVGARAVVLVRGIQLAECHRIVEDGCPLRREDSFVQQRLQHRHFLHSIRDGQPAQTTDGKIHEPQVDGQRVSADVQDGKRKGWQEKSIYAKWNERTTERKRREQMAQVNLEIVLCGAHQKSSHAILLLA